MGSCCSKRNGSASTETPTTGTAPVASSEPSGITTPATPSSVVTTTPSTFTDLPNQTRRGSSGSAVVNVWCLEWHTVYCIAFLSFAYGVLLTVWIWKVENFSDCWQEVINIIFIVVFVLILLSICVPNAKACYTRVTEDGTCCECLCTSLACVFSCRRKPSSGEGTQTQTETISDAQPTTSDVAITVESEEESKSDGCCCKRAKKTRTNDIKLKKKGVMG